MLAASFFDEVSGTTIVSEVGAADGARMAHAIFVLLAEGCGLEVA